jgi:ornithine--oxo-acid transaminase
LTFDLHDLIRRRQGENLALHEAHINPQFAKVLRTIGFDQVYTRGEGAYLYDREGRQYLDLLSGYGVFNIGRNHPVVVKALKDYLEASYPTLVKMDASLLAGLLAEELKKRVDKSLEMVYFTNSGTEGIETAMKFARCATARPRVLYCNHAFHGLTHGSLSINGDGHFRDGFEPLLAGCCALELNDLGALEAELAKGDVAALILEPIQGKGVFIATEEYLREAAALCRKHGALIVFDEVQTGLGRTGKLFAHEHSGVIPDVLVLSKALSGGFVPVGAVITRREVFLEVFSSMERCVVHSSTFGQGGFAMAAGLATLSVIDDEGLVENARRMGELLLNGLREMAGRFELIREVRGRGCFIAVEFGRPTSFKLKLGWDLVHKLNSGLFGQAIVMPLLADHRILTQVAGHGIEVLKLLPPLVINESDVAWFLEAFESVVEKSHRFPGPIWEVTSRLAKHAIRR